jgi:hypothetical protein
MRQRPGQPVFVAAQRCFRGGIALLGFFNNLIGRQTAAGL